MRRLTAFILVAFMLTAAVLPVFAADETNIEAEVIHSQGATQEPGEVTAGVPVTHGVAEGYVVTIPSYIPLLPPTIGLESDAQGNKYNTITELAITTITLSARDVYLPRAKKLTVSLKSDNYDNGWKVVSTTNAAQKLSYAISPDANLDTTVTPETSVMNCPGGTATASKDLYLAVTQLPRVGGYYRDDITFTVKVVANS